MIVATVGLMIQRRDFFYQAERDWLSEDSLLFLGVVLLLTAMPALALSAKKQTRVGRGIKVLATLLGVLSLGTFLAAHHPRVRYWAYRSDCLGMQLGFSAFETPRKELNEEIIDPNIGPYIALDLPLLKYLALEHGTEFRQHPHSARVALASLKALGLSIEELGRGPEGQRFLEVALVGEAQSEPWREFDWIDATRTAPIQALHFSAGLFSREEAQEVVDEALAHLPQASQDTYESLLAIMMSFPGLISKAQGDEILTAWARSLGERAEILEAGAELRKELCEILKGAASLKVSFDLEVVKHFEPEDVEAKNLDVTFKRSVLGLIRSCGVRVEETPADQADLQIAATLKDVKLYEYDRNIYEVRSSYLPSSQTRRIGRASLRVGSVRTEAVVVGSETAVRRGPGFRLEIRYQGQTYDTEMALFYWYQWVIVNVKDPDYSVLNQDGTYGRLWPFGVNENLIRPYRPR